MPNAPMPPIGPYGSAGAGGHEGADASAGMPAASGALIHELITAMGAPIANTNVPVTQLPVAMKQTWGPGGPGGRDGGAGGGA